MEKPVQDQQFGCTDQAGPENHSVEELSRIADLLYAAEQVGSWYRDAVYAIIPRSVKLEFTFANWQYQAVDPNSD